MPKLKSLVGELLHDMEVESGSIAAVYGLVYASS